MTQSSQESRRNQRMRRTWPLFAGSLRIPKKRHGNCSYSPLQTDYSVIVLFFQSKEVLAFGSAALFFCASESTLFIPLEWSCRKLCILLLHINKLASCFANIVGWLGIFLSSPLFFSIAVNLFFWCWRILAQALVSFCLRLQVAALILEVQRVHTRLGTLGEFNYRMPEEDIRLSWRTMDYPTVSMNITCHAHIDGQSTWLHQMLGIPITLKSPYPTARKKKWDA